MHPHKYRCNLFSESLFILLWYPLSKEALTGSSFEEEETFGIKEKKEEEKNIKVFVFFVFCILWSSTLNVYLLGR